VADGRSRAVYVFSDPRYEIGVKVGYGRLGACLGDAQGYSPEGLVCSGAWSFADREASASAEKKAHSALTEHGIMKLSLPDSNAPRNGTEWFECSADIAVSILEELFAAQAEPFQLPRLGQDKVLSKPERQGRMVLWVFKEELTDHLKISACSEFTSPIAARRRYSRNGYTELAAYVARPPIDLAKNQFLYATREKMLADFGTGERSQKYGWVSNAAVEACLIEALGAVEELSRLTNLSIRPTGVRPSYTGSRCHVPDNEFHVFSEIWWRKS